MLVMQSVETHLSFVTDAQFINIYKAYISIYLPLYFSIMVMSVNVKLDISGKTGLHFKVADSICLVYFLYREEFFIKKLNWGSDC